MAIKAKSEALTPAQERVIAALLVERSEKRACIAADVPYSTYQRWKRQQYFVDALSNHQSRIVDTVSNRIIAAADNLSKRVLDLSDNINVEVSDLIKLVQFVLPFAVEMHDRKALLARIATLEQMHNKQREPWEKTIEGEIPCQKLLP